MGALIDRLMPERRRRRERIRRWLSNAAGLLLFGLLGAMLGLGGRPFP